MTQDPILEMMNGARQREVFYWYGRYTAIAKAEPHRVAVLKVSGKIIDNSVDRLAEDLFWLQQHDFNPALTFGWSESLTERLGRSGIETKKIKGDRVTTEREMPYVLKEAQEKGAQLIGALQSRGVKSIYLGPDHGVVIGRGKTEPGYGVHNGDVEAINTSPIIDAISGYKIIPVVCILGISRDGSKLYNINNVNVGTALVQALDPEFFGLVTGTAGVLGRDRRILPELVLKRDYAGLVGDGTLFGDMLKNVDEAKKMLEDSKDGYKRSVRVVGVDTLLPEMFYDRGGGTEIRLGYDINIVRISDMDKALITEIVRDSLGEELREDYFHQAAGKGSVVFWERGNKGFLISQGYYVDIAAVRKESQGNHLGNDLFVAFADYQGASPKAYWRSRTDREGPANDFYQRFIKRFPDSGFQEFVAYDGTRYCGYWFGLKPREIADGLELMRNKPRNYKPK